MYRLATLDCDAERYSDKAAMTQWVIKWVRTTRVGA